MRHRTLTPEDEPLLREFCRRYPWVPYAQYGLPPRRLSEHFLALLREPLHRGLVAGCGTSRALAGLTVLQQLPWDSRLFGLRMASLELYLRDGLRDAARTAGLLVTHADRACRAQRLQHVTAKLPTTELEAVQALEARGFRMADTTVTYSARLSEAPRRAAVPRSAVTIRLLRRQDIEPLARMTREIFADRREILNRFNGDSALRSRAGRLYAEWFRNSCAGEQADAVLVAASRGRPIGYLTCKLMAERDAARLGLRIGVIPLNVVHSAHRRRGVYTRLVLAAFAWFARRGAEVVEIKTPIHTQGVHAAWQRLNGRLVHATYVLHRGRNG